MEYLVEGHLGGYYVSCSDPEIIEEYCEQCGDHDRIILSWEEDKQLETLLEYFSNIKMSQEQLEICKSESLTTKEELIDSLMWSYDDDRYLINEMAGNDIVTFEEREMLLKQIAASQKKQFELLKSIYYANGYVREKNYKN